MKAAKEADDFETAIKLREKIKQLQEAEAAAGPSFDLARYEAALGKLNNDMRQAKATEDFESCMDIREKAKKLEEAKASYDSGNPDAIASLESLVAAAGF